MGWRGDSVVLVADETAATRQIDAVDISTGKRWTVHRPASQLRLLASAYPVIVAAAQLTDEARRRVGF